MKRVRRTVISTRNLSNHRTILQGTCELPRVPRARAIGNIAESQTLIRIRQRQPDALSKNGRASATDLIMDLAS